MSSINTNTSAMNALNTLRNINADLETTQDRIGSGLKISSAKDNAAYYSISESMKGDSGTYAAIDEGLTLTKNSVATARLGSETIQELATKFQDKVAFAQGAKGGLTEIENDLKELVKQMETTLQQSTFNGDDMVGAGGTAGTAAVVDATTGAFTSRTTSTMNSATTPAAVDASPRNVVTGITRAGGNYATTTIDVETVDLKKLVEDFKQLSTAFATNAGNVDTGEAFLAGALQSTQLVVQDATTAATKMGQAEKSIENQQAFLKQVTANIDTGVGAMVDADMESEAARLQALQVQQQLATQSLSIANQAPQNLLSLFK